MAASLFLKLSASLSPSGFFGEALGDTLGEALGEGFLIGAGLVTDSLFDAAWGLKGLTGDGFVAPSSSESSSASNTDIKIFPAAAGFVFSLSFGLGVLSLAAKVSFLRRFKPYFCASIVEDDAVLA